MHRSHITASSTSPYQPEKYTDEKRLAQQKRIWKLQEQNVCRQRKETATIHRLLQRKQRHTGKVWLAMFGSHYGISDKDKEDEKKRKRGKEGRVSLLPLRQLTKNVQERLNVFSNFITDISRIVSGNLHFIHLFLSVRRFHDYCSIIPMTIGMYNV